MSGHSKWSQIKRQKAVADQRRSGVFTKLANAITVAAKAGGPDPDMNFQLRMAVDKAKSANMPNDNVERAIERVTGGGDGAVIEEVLYEAYGPNGVAIIIEAATDNRNRTASSVKSILAKHNASLGNPNSVLWMFDKKGTIRVAADAVTDGEAFSLAAIDAGAEDIETADEGFTVVTAPELLEKVQAAIAKSGYAIASSEIELIPQNTVSLSPQQQESLQKLLDALDDDEDITNHYTNATDG